MFKLGCISQALKNLKVAILIADGFEQSELALPKKALEDAGAETTIVSPVQGKVKGWQKKNWGDEFPVDLDLDKADDIPAFNKALIELFGSHQK